MFKLLFIGPPGSGKGTQAKLLEKFGLIQISTGDIIRAAFKDENPKIMPYKEKIEAGEFLPDNLIVELVKDAIKNLPEDSNGYVLDGAFRTVEQAKFALKEKVVDTIIYFVLSDEEAVKRLTNRAKIEGRRDDSPEAIKTRLGIYYKDTKPTIDFFKENLKVIEVDASPIVEEIHKEVLEKLNLK